MDMHMLADHLTFVDFLVAPLLHVHRGPETLLFVQSLVVASAAFPLFFLGRRLVGSERSALFFAWMWLLSYEVHMGVMFDYNPSTMGAALLCWTAWALVCRGPVAVLLTSLLAMACKEDFAPYVATIAAVLVLVRAIRWPRGALVSLFALAFFACGLAAQDLPPAAQRDIDFKSDVEPIFKRRNGATLLRGVPLRAHRVDVRGNSLG